MKANKEISTNEAYRLTHNRTAIPFKDAPETITVKTALQVDRADASGVVQTITVIEDIAGILYASNSVPIAQTIGEMIDFNVIPENTPIKIVKSRSKSGREYFTAELA